MANNNNSIAPIDECVETLSMGHVTKRKVFGFKGLIWLALGIAALVAQTFDKENGSLTMGLLMVGLSLTIYGLIVFVFKKERYFYDDKPMKMRDYLFDAERFDDLMKLYDDGNFGDMLDIGHASASKVKLRVLFATDYSVAFSQFYKFDYSDFAPATPVRIHDAKQCNNLNTLVVSY